MGVTASICPQPRSKEHTISIKIILPTAFIRHTDGQKQLSSNAENLPALITDIDQNFPALSTQIKDETGKLRRFINVYVNDEDIRFLGGEAYAFQDGDEVMLIPSIAGGAPAEPNPGRQATIRLKFRSEIMYPL